MVESDIVFFSNGDVREVFVVDEHYVGPARNRPAPSFYMGVDCHEGYMILVRAGMTSTQADLVGESIDFTQFCAD